MKKIITLLTLFLFLLAGCEQGIIENAEKLQAPSAITVVSSTVSTVTLSWTNTDDKSLYYEIYCAAENSSGSAVSKGTTNNTIFTVSELSAGMSYYFWIKTKNNYGFSTDFSSPVIGITAPMVPENISSTAATSSSITLTWSPVTGATGYKIYRSATAAGTYSVVGTVTGSTVTNYTDEGLTIGLMYYYKVAAVNSGGESDVSLYFETGTNGIKVVLVEGGTFNNGTANVTLSSFYIGKYEVTQDEYATVMGSNPSYFYWSSENGEEQTKLPVEQVSWYDALVFCNNLSINEGLTPCYTINSSMDPSVWGSVPTSLNSMWDTAVCNMSADGYRLPTEAEWQFAARGGNNSRGYGYSGSNSVGDVAWYASNSGSRTHQVGLKSANELGLYDMSGNVWEWCWDWYGNYSASAQVNPVGVASGTYRILRGDSWYPDAAAEPVSYRGSYYPFYRYFHTGIRVVRRDSVQ